MAFVSVQCPHCGEHDVVKRGKTSDGKQRYLCTNTHCAANTFMLDYAYQGCLPDVIKRLARKTICFSKLETMHEIVIGLFINRYEFGRCV
jgi:transposase-like protein